MQNNSNTPGDPGIPPDPGDTTGPSDWALCFENQYVRVTASPADDHLTIELKDEINADYFGKAGPAMLFRALCMIVGLAQNKALEPGKVITPNEQFIRNPNVDVRFARFVERDPGGDPA